MSTVDGETKKGLPRKTKTMTKNTKTQRTCDETFRLRLYLLGTTLNFIIRQEQGCKKQVICQSYN